MWRPSAGDNATTVRRSTIPRKSSLCAAFIAGTLRDEFVLHAGTGHQTFISAKTASRSTSKPFTGLRHRPLKTKRIGLTSSDLSEEPGEASFIRTGRPEVALNARGVSEPRLGQSQDRYTLPVEFSRSTEMTAVP